MTITAINKRRRQNIYDIYVDGKLYASMSDHALGLYHWKEGEAVEESLFASQVYDAVNTDAVYYLLSLLTKRAYTYKMAKDKLSERDYPEHAIDFALNKAASYGYIDDNEYCKDYIDECHKTRSNRRIRQDLREKGIATDVIDMHLKENDESGACMLSLERKARGKEWTDEFVAKLIRYLMGQGYEYDVVKTCVKAYEERWEV